MEKRLLALLIILGLVCLLLPSVFGGRRHRRWRGGWNCDEEYDDDDDDDDGDDDDDDNEVKEHICYQCKTENVTKTKWYWGSCDGNSTSCTYGNCCIKKKYVIEPVTRCMAVCCQGWTTDYNGRCTIKVSEAEQIICENGGTKTAAGTCLCRQGFSGKTCNQAICTLPCQNHGTCEGDNGVPVCVCPTGTTGKQCETPVCQENCKNGGKCLYQDYGSSVCVCPEDYEGPACEHRIKRGDCPVPLNIYKCWFNYNKYKKCTYDGDCEGEAKCCFNGCTKHCLTPVTETCLYEGISYKINQTFSPQPCTTCSCLYPGEMSGVECTSVDCPNLDCKTKIYPADSCCPVCGDSGTPGGHGPTFASCPKDAEAHVLPGSNKTDLHTVPKLKLKVYDHTGMEYNYKFSTRHISHCGCNTTKLNRHHVVATSSPDKYGRFATCTIPVQVLDPFPPILRCPTDINAFEGETIAWDEPTVKDNVGINKLELRFGKTNNTIFEAGRYLVVYAAKDYDGNEAICTFLISVFSIETERQYLPPQLQSGPKQETQTAAIAGAVIGVIAALLLVLLLWLCVRRCKKPADRPEPNSFENNVYAVYEVPPPAYDNIIKEKLPEYAEDPPVYEAIEPKDDKGKGVDNPLYGVTGDAETTPDDVEVTIQQNGENEEKEY